MARSSQRFPVLAWSLSGFGAMVRQIVYLPLWIVVFFAISFVYTYFFNIVNAYHHGEIVAKLTRNFSFDFTNFSGDGGLDYIFQLKDLFELALPIGLAYFTVIPIAIAKSSLSQNKPFTWTGNIGFGQTELLVALNTIVAYVVPVLVALFGWSLITFVVGLIFPHAVAVSPSVATDASTQARALPALTTMGSLISYVIIVPMFVLTYVGTLLSLPYSIEENRLGVLYSWRTLQPVYWRAFRMQMLAVVWGALTCVALYFVFWGIYKTWAPADEPYDILFNGDIGVRYFFYLLEISIMYTLFLIITLTPATRVYRQLRKAEPVEAEALPEAGLPLVDA